MMTIEQTRRKESKKECGLRRLIISPTQDDDEARAGIIYQLQGSPKCHARSKIRMMLSRRGKQDGCRGGMAHTNFAESG